MDDLDIDKILRDLDTLTLDEAKTKLTEVTAATEQLDEKIKDLKADNAILKEGHPAASENSDNEMLQSTVLQSEAYHKVVMVCRHTSPSVGHTNSRMQKTVDNTFKKMLANLDQALTKIVKDSADIRKALRDELQGLDPSVLESAGWKEIVEGLANAED
jgi:DNA repair exonuclease SbcCD ATPase subunit